MKTMKWISLVLLAVTGATPRVNGETFRTDINPALRYFQAFNVAPELPQADRDYLFTNEWRGQKLPQRFGDLVSEFDKKFKLVGQAAHASVPCDWGIDFSPGPETLLGHLSRIKAIAQTARLRTLWDLQNARQTEARSLAAWLPNWRLAMPGAGIAIVLIAGLFVLIRSRESVPPAATLPRVEPTRNPLIDPDPTIANYQMVANRSLDMLDELLTRQGIKGMSPTPDYSATVLAPGHALD